MRLNVPFEWQALAKSGVLPPYWITYFGDIYSGWYTECHQADDRFYILSNNQFHDFRKLTSHTVAEYQKLAWEIRDSRIILDHIAGVDSLGDNAMPPAWTRDMNRKTKRMIVLGAGASAFCSFNDTLDLLSKSPFKPPTGNEIFDQRFDPISFKYEGALASVPDFEAKGRDIETCLEDDWDLIRNFFSPHITAKHTNIQFYLQDLFSQISEEVVKKYFRYNLYAVLVNKLLNTLQSSQERISFVSFNYDTILDSFLERALQIKFTGMEDYMGKKNSMFFLFKPHGSSNWGWPFYSERIGDTNGKTIPQFLFEKQFIPGYIYYNLLGGYKKMLCETSWGYEKEMNPHNIGRYTINKNVIEVVNKTNGKVYFPALQLPYRDKDEFVMPFTHYDTLKTTLSEVEELYLVGWKGNEDGFNRLLKNHAYSIKKVTIVNPDPDSVIKNLAPYLDLTQTKYQVNKIGSFKEFVLEKLDGYLAS